jgi:hypothetical protein
MQKYLRSYLATNGKYGKTGEKILLLCTMAT